MKLTKANTMVLCRLVWLGEWELARTLRHDDWLGFADRDYYDMILLLMRRELNGNVLDWEKLPRVLREWPKREYKRGRPREDGEIALPLTLEFIRAGGASRVIRGGRKEAAQDLASCVATAISGPPPLAELFAQPAAAEARLARIRSVHAAELERARVRHAAELDRERARWPALDPAWLSGMADRRIDRLSAALGGVGAHQKVDRDSEI